jgi:hypothetical protein
LSLLDEHLAKAIKHAPDSDLVPSEIVRKNVLNYANKVNNANKPSQPPHKHWLAGLLPNIKNWPKKWYFAGMSSVAVALLAVIMLREQLPEEPIWRESRVREVAQNSAPAPEKALKEERADIAAAPASIQEEAPARTAGAQDKEKAESPAVVPALADKDNGVIAEDTAKVEARPAASAEQTIASVEKSEAEEPAAAKKSVMLVDAGALGVAKANQDIHAGVLRILVLGWPVNKPLLDEATGYRVELVTDLAPAELAAYNQTMRDWFNTQH